MSRPKVLALYMYMYMYVSFIVIITFSSRVDANASPERRGRGSPMFQASVLLSGSTERAEAMEVGDTLSIF